MKNEQRIEEIKAEIAAAGGHLEGHICVHVEFEPDGSIACITTAGPLFKTATATVYYDSHREEYLTRFKDGSPDFRGTKDQAIRVARFAVGFLAGRC